VPDRNGTRQRLIACATALLAEEGVEAVTLRRIAREAEVSHGAPLRHFGGRAELLSAVAETGFRTLLARVAALAKEAPNATKKERLAAACRSYVDFATRQPAMFELMFRHDLVDAEALSGVSEAVFDQFCKLVADVQAQGWRQDVDPRMLAASLWAALHGLVDLWAGEHLAGALTVTLDAYLG
jgi:AcrR family transcriptional regulator